MEEKIIHATVFSDRVIVERKTEIEYSGGDNFYLFKNIPAHAVKESMRIKGTGEIIIEGMDIKIEYLNSYINEQVNKLTEELENLLFKEININKNKELNNYIKDFLNGIKISEINSSNKEYFKDLKVEDYQDFYNFISSNLDDINIEDFKNNNNIIEIKNKINTIKHELNQIKKGSSLNSITCKINYSSNKNAKSELYLSYLLTGASWQPLYDARLDYKKRIIELSYFAVVSQNTGEDWNDINISFSTATPQIGAYLPELKTWFVDFYYPPPPPAASFSGKLKAGLKKASKKLDLAAEDSDTFADDEKECEEQAEAIVEIPGAQASIDKNLVNQSEVKSSGLNVCFDAKNKYSLKSDGTSNKAILLIDEFPVKLQYIIIPKISENAYLKAVILNDKEYPLLKGGVKVYHDNNYVGDSVINFIASREEFELFIGIDSQIEVKYILMNKFIQKTGLTSQYKKIIYKYKILINSYKEKEEEIICFEQIPISADKEIKIKIDEKDIFDEPDIQGILKAVFTINPKEKKEINFSYSIEYPKDKYINEE